MRPFRILVVLHWILTGIAVWQATALLSVVSAEGHPQQIQSRGLSPQTKNNNKPLPPHVKPFVKAKTPAPPPKLTMKSNTVCSPRDDFLFQPTVIITLLGRPGQVTPADFVLLQRLIVQAYNKAATCGSPMSGSFLRLEQVSINTDSVNASMPASLNTTQTFTVIATTQGSCRGCKTSPFHLFNGPPPPPKGPPLSRKRSRGLSQPTRPTRSPLVQLQLQNHIVSSSSWSKTSVAGNRGGDGSYNKAGAETKRMPPILECMCPVPSKVTFLNDLNTMVPVLLLPKSIDHVVDVNEYVPVCVKPNTFNTFISVDFSAGIQDPLNVTNIEAQYQVLQDAVVNAYNDVGSANTCTLQVTQAVVVVAPDTGYGTTGLNRRQLKSKSSFSSFLTSFTFSIRGKCRGCTNSVALFNDAQARRRLGHVWQHDVDGGSGLSLQHGEEDEWADHEASFHRQLQSVKPTTNAFVQALNDQLQTPLASGSITIVSTAQNALQVNPVNCSSQVSFFQAAATISFSGNVTSLTSEQLALLGQNFQLTYNSLAQQNCDPLFRTIQSVQYVGAAPPNTRRDLMFEVGGSGPEGDESRSLQLLSTLIVLVTGRCRGCTQNTALFNDVTARLRNLSPLTSTDIAAMENNQNIESQHAARASWQPRQPRGLQPSFTQCYCYYFANTTTAPGLNSFFSAYNQSVASTNATSTLIVNNVNEPTNISVTLPPTEAPSTQTRQPSSAPITPKPTNRPSLLTTAPAALPTPNPTSLTYSPTLIKSAPTISPSIARPSSPPSTSNSPTKTPEPSASSKPSVSPEPSFSYAPSRSANTNTSAPSAKPS